MTGTLNNLTIRKMKFEDIQLISNMFTKQGWDSRENVLSNYLEEQTLGTRIVLVAELDNHITGYVTLIKVTTHGPFSGKFPEVADFNVFETYQKLGIGNKLLDSIEKEAKTFSDIITIGVGMHKGYGSAQRMYVKRGYIPDGTGLWYNNKNLEMNETCINNDELAIYLSKAL
ncbi:GNAT family N-acetyltransferase [Vagococcus fluvialis]|uniref:GNAT family N-acetyltransferase n=1 Tax=Vagococcus fluvialis TaxID=2738 RepID=UPI001A8CE17F|nr:GNAT family N-acetyltransferase [Vagococcus fluvialis]MBO0429481.1 GNAT family N-acetyltransferase [Vagococcus fluvialis]